jgi:translocation and assembly module TamB
VKRRLAKIFLVLTTLLLLLVVFIYATHPIWLGSVLHPLLRRYGVTFSKYERLNKERFVLTDVRYTNTTAAVQLGRMEAFLPLVWRRKVLHAATNENELPTFVEVSGWKVTIRTNDAKPKNVRTPPDIYPLFKKAEDNLAQARKWVPRASFANGILTLQGREYNIGSITWDMGKLLADGVWPETAVPVEIKADLDGQGPYQLSYAMHPLDLRIRLRVVETNGGLNSILTGFFKENRGDLNARFATTGWLPETAQLKGHDLSFEGKSIGLPQIEQVKGSLDAEWKTNGFTAELGAQGEPASEFNGKVPPLEVSIKASGDTNRVLFEKLVAVTPGIQARVEEPVWISTRGELLSTNVNASIVAELEKLPWFKGTGKLRANIFVRPGNGRYPSVHASVQGEILEIQGVRVEKLTASGGLRWPLLENLEVTAQFDSNSFARVKLGADLEQKLVSGGTLTATGAIARALVPTNFGYDHLRLAADFSGPFTQLVHGAEFEMRGFKAPQLAPMQIDGRWGGRQFEVETATLRARAGPAVLFLGASLQAEASGRNLLLRELTLKKGEELYLSLVQPAQIFLGPEQGRKTIQLTNFNLEGPSRALQAQVHLDWPDSGQARLAATNIHPELFQFFTERSLRGVKLDKFSADVSWTTNGPLTGSVRALGEFIQDQLQSVRAEIRLDAAAEGVQLTRLDLSEETGSFLTAEGFLPVRLFPNAEQKIDWVKEGTMDFYARSTTNEHFWNTIAKFTGVALSNPVVSLELKNKVRDPQIGLQIAASSFHYLKATNDLPKVEDVRAKAFLTERNLHLNDLFLRLEQQPIRVFGTVGLGTNFWSSRREEIQAYILQNSDLTVLGTNIAVAPFTRFFPQYIAPEGVVQVNAGVKQGMQFTGEVKGKGLSTRPLPHIGVVANISTELELSNRVVKIAFLRGDLGGETLTISGSLDVSSEFLELGYPAANLKIRGNNIPLARNPDVILRSDLDLEVITVATNRPLVTGVATLRDSVLMRDIDTLAPGRVTKPRRRPPFFSIEMDPVDDWKLDLRVRGDNFMRVRSPFFTGLASANFKVEGTAREPLALGEVTLNSGVVAFPFASLGIRQGLVSMTSENPYVPQVFVTAGGRAFGFDITMHAEGPAHEPVLTFSSVPALTSEEIVLMLTTGQIPRQDFSFSNEQRASKLAFFLGKSLWSKFKGDSGGEDKLEIRSGEDISEQGRQTYAVEYKMTDRWSLVGEYDRFGALNAGVKWKIYTR